MWRRHQNKVMHRRVEAAAWSYADADGKIYTVRYDAVNAMLLNEFLKEHRRMEVQDKRIEELTAELKQQGALIQKVSAQLEASKPAPQVVKNP